MSLTGSQYGVFHINQPQSQNSHSMYFLDTLSLAKPFGVNLSNTTLFASPFFCPSLGSDFSILSYYGTLLVKDACHHKVYIIHSNNFSSANIKRSQKKINTNAYSGKSMAEDIIFYDCFGDSMLHLKSSTSLRASSMRIDFVHRALIARRVYHFRQQRRHGEQQFYRPNDPQSNDSKKLQLRHLFA